MDFEPFRFTETTDPDFQAVFGGSLPYGNVPVKGSVSPLRKFGEALRQAYRYVFPAGIKIW